MDIIFKELKNQHTFLQSEKFSFTYSEKNDKVAVIVEPRKLEIFPYIVYNVMYNLGPEWNLHIFAHDQEFIIKCLPRSLFSYKLSIICKDNLTPDDYNRMFKSVNFWNSIKEEHILIFQTDSCIINPIPNIDNYLQYPYIGGIYQYSCPEKILDKDEIKGYPYNWLLHSNQVQLHNTPYHHYSICGGFSFRKKSAMIHCIHKVDKQQIINYRNKFAMNTNYYAYEHHEIGEDTFFQHALEMLNYELPKIDTCIDFCENLSGQYTNKKTFGLHNINKIDNQDKNTINIIKQISNDLHEKQRHINIEFSKKKCIITACTGNYKQHIKSIDHLGIDGYIFGDANVTWEGTNWKRIHKSYFEHNDNFVKAKFYKCNWNNIPELSEYEIVIWIDATIEIKSLPDLDKNTDIIVYNHSYRSDIHSEICASRDVRYINYMKGLQFQYDSYPPINWLAITCFIINRRCTDVEKMNNFWFNENIKHSPQDQVSFPVACEKFNIKIKRLDSLSDSHVFTEHYYKHKHNIPYDKYNNIR